MVSGGFKLFLVLVSTKHLYILPKLQRSAWKVHIKTAIFIATHFKIHIMAYPVLIFQLTLTLIKSAIYFRDIEKDFDFLASGGYVVKYGSIVSKVFDIFFCNNKNQVMIIKLLKLYKQFEKE